MTVSNQFIKISFTHISYPHIFSQILKNTFLQEAFKNRNSGKTRKSNMIYTYYRHNLHIHTTWIAKIRHERDRSGMFSFIQPLFIIHSLSYLFLLHNYNTVFLFYHYAIYSSSISSSSILRVLKLLQNHYLRNVGHFYYISVVWKKECWYQNR